jgi:hypothetical protein
MTAAIGPWGEGAGALERWLARGECSEATLLEPSGFIVSRFNPLVYTAVSRCLDEAGAELDGDRTGVVLASVLGDATTADVASRNLVEGRVHNPLLFYQSVPTSILGYLGRERGIRGPLACVSAGADAAERSRELAELMIESGDADAVLVVYAELANGERSRAVHRALEGGELGELGCEDDVVICLLLRRDGSASAADGYDRRASVPPGTDPTRRLGEAARQFVAWAASRPVATGSPERSA